MKHRLTSWTVGLAAFAVSMSTSSAQDLGVEKAIAKHFADGDEFSKSLKKVLDHGDELFAAMWTKNDGQGRPLTGGTGNPLAEPNEPLTGARRMNLISGPDANGCEGCHNLPFAGSGGDFKTSLLVHSNRFDFADFDNNDLTPLEGAADEAGNPVTLQKIGNIRSAVSLHGAGYIEMLARQITEDLQADRDTLAPGQSIELVSERTGDLSFGTLSRDGGGLWDTSLVDGLPPTSTETSGAGDPPTLIVQPFRADGTTVSLRKFANDAMNHHHGMQTFERFGLDADGDGVESELTIADTTALAAYMARYPAPGRVIPRDPVIEEAVKRGEFKFKAIGCTDCHIPELPLEDPIFTEPNPFNPADGNLDPNDAYVATFGTFAFDLNNPKQDVAFPRLKAKGNGITMVPAFTDLKLHDITDHGLSGPNDPDEDPLNGHLSPPSSGTNSFFLTRKLWGFANEPPYYHHGRFMTIREAIEAHKGDALTQATAWSALSDDDKNAIIEFLKTLQQIEPGTTEATILDGDLIPRKWQKFAAKEFD
jgi:Di-haem oxidoreductase, putative peroxidase